MVTNSLFDKALEAAQMLIRVPSFNPPGRERGVAEVARDYLSRSGISSSLLLLDEDRASVVARVGGARSAVSSSVVTSTRWQPIPQSGGRRRSRPLSPTGGSTDSERQT